MATIEWHGMQGITTASTIFFFTIFRFESSLNTSGCVMKAFKNVTIIDSLAIETIFPLLRIVTEGTKG